MFITSVVFFFLQILFKEKKYKKKGIQKLTAVSARKVFHTLRKCLHKAIIVFI